MPYVWCLTRWKKYIDANECNNKCGLRMHYSHGIDLSVRYHLDQFAKWLRKEFEFPLRVNIYVKKERRIKAVDGEMVVGTFWKPNSYKEFPYIRLATGDYPELVASLGQHKAILAILHTFAHELTHYYQHINNLNLSVIGEERQATTYANDIIWEYSRQI